MPDEDGLIARLFRGPNLPEGTMAGPGALGVLAPIPGLARGAASAASRAVPKRPKGDIPDMGEIEQILGRIPRERPDAFMTSREISEMMMNAAGRRRSQGGSLGLPDRVHGIMNFLNDLGILGGASRPDTRIAVEGFHTVAGGVGELENLFESYKQESR